MASWKLVHQPTERAIQYVSLLNSRKYFALDASGSTGGSPLASEEAFVNSFHALTNKPFTTNLNDTITKWGTECRNPVNNWNDFVWRSDMGGTQPSAILQNEMSLSAIHSADVFFLLTDGEVWDQEVYNLARLSKEKNIFNVATVFLITSYKGEKPASANVSVGITSYANCVDAICLFKNYVSGEIYVMAAKGIFEKLDQAQHSKEEETWEDLMYFKDEQALIKMIESLDIKVATADTRPAGLAGLDLGPKWNAAHQDHTLVDIDKLLKAGRVEESDLNLLLADETIDNLILACKSWGKLAEFRQFLLSQRVEQITVALEDVSDAAGIITRLGNTDLDTVQRESLRTQLRAAHLVNRQHYQAALTDTSSAGEASRAHNRLVDGALSNLADVEKAGFTADVLSRRSNRARRAGGVATDAPVEVNSLDFNAAAFRAECEICCGDEEIMSLAFRAMTADQSAANTDNFALDFPLAAGRFEGNVNALSSQCICFQCAYLIGQSGRSIYAEDIVAVIPTLEYSGNNKMYINQQLYIALTGGLKTGVPTLGQLFATILDRTLATKVWAGAPDPTVAGGQARDREIEKRRRTLEYLLETVLANLRVRETFNELGAWCLYPKALTWAAGDFETNSLTSWAINYPIAGFDQLICFGTRTRAFAPEQVRTMKATKLLHSFVSAYLAKLYKEGKDRNWTKDLLSLIYSEFNDSLIPRDLGEDSILTDVSQFWSGLKSFLGADPQLLEGWSAEDQLQFMPRIQVLAFWLVYFQLAHTSAKTYFSQLKEKEPLSTGVLNLKAALPKTVADEVLRSPFIKKDAFIDKRAAAQHILGIIPFVSPFGASVLRCGHPGCEARFYPETVDLKSVIWTPQLVDKVRDGRRKHLISAFGTHASFEKSQTGLPEPVKMPSAPTTSNVCMHISIARVWARLPYDDRRAVGQAIAAADLHSEAIATFVKAVRAEICTSFRGDVFSPALDDDIRDLLPSFITAMRKALVLEGKSAGDVGSFLHKFDKNKLDQKIKYEIEAEF